jgi:hypothetical protein
MYLSSPNVTVTYTAHYIKRKRVIKVGSPINFIFKNSESKANIVLYSHWGAGNWEYDLAVALDKARPRWGEPEYLTSILTRQLIGADWDGTLGYGLYVTTGESAKFSEKVVLIDVVRQEVNGKSFDLFIDIQADMKEYHTV